MRAWMISLILVVVVLVAASCSSASKLINRPLPKIVGKSVRESLGFNYKIFVDCTVRNDGAAGSVIVTANLTARDGFWEKQAKFSMEEDTTRSVALEFSEPSFFSNVLATVRYNCSASGFLPD